MVATVLTGNSINRAVLTVLTAVLTVLTVVPTRGSRRLGAGPLLMCWRSWEEPVAHYGEVEAPVSCVLRSCHFEWRSLQALDPSALAFRCAGCSTSRFLFHYPALSTLHHYITYIHHPLTVLLMLLIYTCHYFNLVVVLHSIMLSLLLQSSPSNSLLRPRAGSKHSIKREQYQQY